MGHKVDAWLVVAAVMLTVALLSQADVAWRVLALVLGVYLVAAVIWDLPLPGRGAPPTIRADTTPPVPPIRYQISALRQVFAKIAETGDDTHYGLLNAVLKSHPRKGMDPVYEPLTIMSCDEGLAVLVHLGEIAPVGSDQYHYRIARQAKRLFPRPSKRDR